MSYPADSGTDLRNLVTSTLLEYTSSPPQSRSRAVGDAHLRRRAAQPEGAAA